MASIITLQKKLISGINHKYHCNVVVNTSQFHRKGSPEPVTITKVSDTYIDDDGSFQSMPLYGSSSSVYVMLYLRDLFFALEGREIPQDNENFMHSKNYVASRDTIKEMVNIYGGVHD